ncbi:MAG TPA: aminotransferase class I/II-fold pyridoxal phosphate-dependent enzyme [Bryobacteraceae bacterium]|nr:aminotransferase class I/II-fold pyridoxal phosphate-dependent enzyme [Bryobacteraceae bacterium]
MKIAHGGDIFAAAGRNGVPWRQVLDFSASINPLGPSPRVKQAILSSVDRIAHYPSICSPDLRRRLAREWRIAEEQILPGAGAVDLLRDFCSYFPEGHLAVPVFGEFHRLWPKAMLCRAVDSAGWPPEGTVVVTRPVNPTGAMIGVDAVIAFLRRSNATILVDESFIDFSSAASLVERTAEFPRLLVLRSLTKFYALPGLRVGALVGHPDTVAPLARLRPPWAVNTLAEQAALAALDDRGHAEATRQFVQQERAWLLQEVAAMPGARSWPPEANYIYIEIPYAAALVRFAAQRNILIRDCTGWPGCEGSGIRVAVRRRWENERLLAVWREFLCEGC